MENAETLPPLKQAAAVFFEEAVKPATKKAGTRPAVREARVRVEVGTVEPRLPAARTVAERKQTEK